MNTGSYICDYGLLDDFLIPALEIGQVDPESVKDLYPWHIPEKSSVIISRPCLKNKYCTNCGLVQK